MKVFGDRTYYRLQEVNVDNRGQSHIINLAKGDTSKEVIESFKHNQKRSKAYIRRYYRLQEVTGKGKGKGYLKQVETKVLAGAETIDELIKKIR